jgi:chromatin segregation and condensation protein Rec8/ScpA/Scc1 (kleisin family)
MDLLDTHHLRSDIVSRLLGGEEDEQVTPFLDRLVEIAEMENGEHQMLVDPIDRSIALVFQLFETESLDPWDVDLSTFIDLFSERLKTAENIDLPSCGRLIRMAWSILHAQTFTLIERHERWEEEMLDDDWTMDIGWESELDDDEYSFSVNVLTGQARDALPNLFEGRIRRTTESRPITLTEMLFSLKGAHEDARERQLREQSRVRHQAEVAEAMANVSSRIHTENLEDDIRKCWSAMRDIGRNGAPVELAAIREHLRALAIEEGANDDEAAIEGEISGFVASLFLTHRGFAEIWQMGKSSEGRIFIKDRWPATSSYEEATIQIAEERGISLVEVEA